MATIRSRTSWCVKVFFFPVANRDEHALAPDAHTFSDEVDPLVAHWRQVKLHKASKQMDVLGRLSAPALKVDCVERNGRFLEHGLGTIERGLLGFRTGNCGLPVLLPTPLLVAAQAPILQLAPATTVEHAFAPGTLEQLARADGLAHVAHLGCQVCGALCVRASVKSSSCIFQPQQPWHVARFTNLRKCTLYGTTDTDLLRLSHLPITHLEVRLSAISGFGLQCIALPTMSQMHEVEASRS